MMVNQVSLVSERNEGQERLLLYIKRTACYVHKYAKNFLRSALGRRILNWREIKVQEKWRHTGAISSS
jgi:hypothetical protein